MICSAFFELFVKEKPMEFWEILGTVVAAVSIIAAIGLLIHTKRRSERLRERFGPEYDRRVAELGGNRHRAEVELKQREARIQELRSRPLSRSDHNKFVNQWRNCQTKFVDDPA